MDLTGVVIKRTVNGLFLKDYLSSPWDSLPKSVQDQMKQLVQHRRQDQSHDKSA